MNTDQERTHAVPTTAAMTLNYVVSFLTLNSPAGSTEDQSAGFNLDSRDTGLMAPDSPADCTDVQADFQGIAPDNQVGVDNQLNVLLSMFGSVLFMDPCPGEANPADRLDCNLRNQIIQGDLLLLVKVSGVNDTAYDDMVSVQLAIGEPMTDADPAMDGIQPMVAGTPPRVTGGQNFRSVMDVGPAVNGDIFNGRLRIQVPVFNITLPIQGMAAMLPVANAEIRFDVAAAGLTNGMLGGGVNLADLAGLVNNLMPGDVCTTMADCMGRPCAVRADGMMHCPSDLESTLYMIAPTYTDLRPCTAAGDCPWPGAMTDGFTCTQLSLGLRLDAVPVVLQ